MSLQLDFYWYSVSAFICEYKKSCPEYPALTLGIKKGWEMGNVTSFTVWGPWAQTQSVVKQNT